MIESAATPQHHALVVLSCCPKTQRAHERGHKGTFGGSDLRKTHSSLRGGGGQEGVGREGENSTERE